MVKTGTDVHQTGHNEGGMFCKILQVAGVDQAQVGRPRVLHMVGLEKITILPL
jgi:hypothetical protein